jgi:hypothetical protein
VSAGTNSDTHTNSLDTINNTRKELQNMAKKILVLLAILTLVVFVACKKEETEVNTTDFTTTDAAVSTDTGMTTTDTGLTTTDTMATDTTGTTSTDTSGTAGTTDTSATSATTATVSTTTT